MLMIWELHVKSAGLSVHCYPLEWSMPRLLRRSKGNNSNKVSGAVGPFYFDLVRHHWTERNKKKKESGTGVGTLDYSDLVHGGE